MNWLRLDQILIDSCYPFLLWSLPYTFCQGMTQYLLEFMGSIWEVPETKLYNSVSLGISTLGPVIFIYFLGYKEYGYVITKTIQEIVGLLFSIWVYQNRLDPQYKGLNSGVIQESLWGLLGFISHSSHNVLQLVMLIVGFEVNTYCATQLGDLDSLATWVIFVYIETILYCTGIGISVGIRAMIGRVLETGGNSKARLMTKVYYLYTCCFAFLVQIFILFWRDDLISIFTQKTEIQSKLQSCLLIYLINCIPELLYLSTSTILKLNKKSDFAFKIFTVFFPVYTGISAFLFCFGFGLRLNGLILSFSTGKALAILLSLGKLFGDRWSIDSQDPQKISLISVE